MAPSARDPDGVLLQRIAVRDESALAELYDRHSQSAYSLLMRILRSAPDAEDVLQETFVRVWSRAETYDPRLGSPAAWLLRIARHRAIDRLRARAVRANLSVERPTPDGSEAQRSEEPATRETPEMAFEQSAAANTIRLALANLSAAQRNLIEAAFFDGRTHQELAAYFNLPLGAVKTRIRTGLTALRERLEQTI